MSSSEDVLALVTPEQYRLQGRERLFPSDGSLQWYCRRHKAQLVAAGALRLHGKRWLVHPTRFDDVIVSLSGAAASRATQSVLELQAAA